MLLQKCHIMPHVPFLVLNEPQLGCKFCNWSIPHFCLYSTIDHFLNIAFQHNLFEEKCLRIFFDKIKKILTATWELIHWMKVNVIWTRTVFNLARSTSPWPTLPTIPSSRTSLCNCFNQIKKIKVRRVWKQKKEFSLFSKVIFWQHSSAAWQQSLQSLIEKSSRKVWSKGLSSSDASATI